MVFAKTTRIASQPISVIRSAIISVEKVDGFGAVKWFEVGGVKLYEMV